MKVKLIDAVFLWAEHHPHLGVTEESVNGARVKIVGMHGRQNEEYFDLPNSTGRCFCGWESATDLQRATHALAVFNWMIRNGVPAAEAHNAFMDIEEYELWVKEETGPFHDAYYAYHGVGK